MRFQNSFNQINIKPLISVLLPLYNAECYLSASIESILNQTCSDFELLILNDGSTDRSKEIILSYRDIRIRYVENNRNMGLIKTLNRGLFLAKGTYIARMDADDLCKSNRFEKQISFLEEHKKTDILGTNQYIINTDSTIQHKMSAEENRIGLLLQPVVAHSSVMIKRASLVQNRLYYDRLALHAEDYKLWVDASLCNLTIRNLEEYLCGYRIHDQQISQTQSFVQTQVADKIRIGYAKCFFEEVIRGQELIYIHLIKGYAPCDSLKVETMKRISQQLVETNRREKFFDLFLFENFINWRLSNLNQNLP